MRILTLFLLCFFSAHIFGQTCSNIGVNLGSIKDWSSEFPFIDLMKQSRAWRTNNTTEQEIYEDEKGWLRKVGEQTVYTYILTGNSNKNRYIKRLHIFFEGKGEFRFIGGTIEESSTGYIIVQVTHDSFALGIKDTDEDDYIRNVEVIPERFLDEYEEKKLFNPEFLNSLDSYTTLRFMDWLKINNSEITNWEQRSQESERTWSEKGVPYEIIIELANFIKKDIWINMPHQATKQYFLNSAFLFHTKLNPKIKLYVEHSNEVWNTSFEQGRYALDAAYRLFGDRPVERPASQWHGIRTAEMCKTFNRMFGWENPQLICVAGTQAAAAQYHVSPLLDCPARESGKSCKDDGIDAVAITSYFTGGLNGRRILNEESDQYAEILRNWASNGRYGLDSVFSQLNTGEPLSLFQNFEDYSGVIPKLKENFDIYKSISRTHGVSILAYEGGQHLTVPYGVLFENNEMHQFYREINLDPRMTELYSELIDLWNSYNFGIHLFYNNISQPSKWGNWGILEHVEMKSSAKLDAIRLNCN